MGCGFLLGVFTLLPLCSEVVDKNDRGGGRGDSKYVFLVIGVWRVSNVLLPFWAPARGWVMFGARSAVRFGDEEKAIDTQSGVFALLFSGCCAFCLLLMPSPTKSAGAIRALLSFSWIKLAALQVSFFSRVGLCGGVVLREGWRGGIVPDKRFVFVLARLSV